MSVSSFPAPQACVVITYLRSKLGIKQTELAQRARLDQSRISRIERGEVGSSEEIGRVLDALAAMGAPPADAVQAFCAREWRHFAPPAFWNPERAVLEIAEDTLSEIEVFLEAEERPWPLRRQIERQRELLHKGAAFLSRLDHNVAFVGDMGVGKSTAISFLFDLLVPPSLAGKPTNCPVLETGGGGTTICEVRIKNGPEFGLAVVPMADDRVRELVADFCAAKWSAFTKEQKEGGGDGSISVSREMERAIRNMCGLPRRRQVTGGKVTCQPVSSNRTYHDPVQVLARSCAGEDEFRSRVLMLMRLPERTRRELWHDAASRKHPMEWLAEVFRDINNGRLKDVPLPASIDLIVPGFGRSFGDLDVAAIDTKGIDDVAVREDLDLRLRDPRTILVFCSRFNDMPGTSARALLQHMRETFSERVDTGKVAIMALPRAGEARAVKDDAGELAQDDAEGYAFKADQVESELTAEGLGGIPTMFFNVEGDEPGDVQAVITEQLRRMRQEAADRLFDICAAVGELIKNSEQQAMIAAIEEVAAQLDRFLQGNRRLGTRERLAHVEAISTIRGVRYASTLWASTRRKGDYYGLSIIHQIGVGAARDARLRCDGWFRSLDAFLNALRTDPGLDFAVKTIEQIGASAALSRTAFLEAVQNAGAEIYRGPLSEAAVWSDCADEWGMGPGFKQRVIDHLEDWFAANPEPKERLEDTVNRLWEQTVISPLLRLALESAPESPASALPLQ